MLTSPTLTGEGLSVFAPSVFLKKSIKDSVCVFVWYFFLFFYQAILSRILFVCLCVCLCVGWYLSMFVCMWVCLCVFVCMWVYVSVDQAHKQNAFCLCACVYVFLCACVLCVCFLCTRVCVCMRVCFFPRLHSSWEIHIFFLGKNEDASSHRVFIASSDAMWKNVDFSGKFFLKKTWISLKNVDFLRNPRFFPVFSRILSLFRV
jgi:hypothetical protein